MGTDIRVETPVAGRRNRRWVLFVLLAVIGLVVWITDQLTKNWVVASLPEGSTVPVLGNFLQWHFVRNPGAAFSFASGATWIFTILAAVVAGVIIWQAGRMGSRLWSVFFGLLLGGVLGNLTDRLTREPGFPVGHVVDFISTPWMMPAIYNVADIAIVTSMVLFVLITLLGIPLDGSPRHRAGHDAVDQDPGADGDLGAGTDSGLETGAETEAEASSDDAAAEGSQ